MYKGAELKLFSDLCLSAPWLPLFIPGELERISADLFLAKLMETQSGISREVHSSLFCP